MSLGASASTLADVDWKVHHVLASDKVAKISRPLVRLQLHLQDAPPAPTSSSSSDTTAVTVAARNEVAIELSREELDTLIEQLEAAKGALDQLKSAV